MVKKNYKLGDACKNTFVIFDCLNKKNIDQNFLAFVHKTLMKEQKDDSLIMIDGHEKNGKYFFKMLVLGQDNILGEFCGNGSRVCAAYLFEKFKQYDHFYLITDRGNLLLSKHEQDIYSINLSSVTFDLNPKIVAKPEVFVKEGSFYYLPFEGKKLYFGSAIEPHLVLKEKISDEELFLLGKRLNEKRDIFPLGINVNSYYEENPNFIHVTTYERGVQRLTLSCGTGSSTCSAFYLDGKKGIVKVQTPGGLLELTINDKGIILKGPAKIKNE